MDPYIFRDRVALTVLTCTVTFLMSLRLICGWKVVGCYQTYSQICVAAVCTWIPTLGRFTMFDGLSKIVIFHTSRNIEILPIIVHVGRHPITRIVGAVQFCRLIPEEVCRVYIYIETETLYICMCIGGLTVAGLNTMVRKKCGRNSRSVPCLRVWVRGPVE